MGGGADVGRNGGGHGATAGYPAHANPPQRFRTDGKARIRTFQMVICRTIFEYK